MGLREAELAHGVAKSFRTSRAIVANHPPNKDLVYKRKNTRTSYQLGKLIQVEQSDKFARCSCVLTRLQHQAAVVKRKANHLLHPIDNVPIANPVCNPTQCGCCNTRVHKHHRTNASLFTHTCSPPAMAAHRFVAFPPHAPPVTAVPDSLQAAC